ncbi:hypothetical protein KUCAC02_034923 [Chaenocephalus aceratus]|nr:hypothetical protein KUCAC02_034923 [Chaenocephalus aceratus]
MFLNHAWTDVGLQGSISHTLLRTALADTVKRYQDPSNCEEALGIRYMFQQLFAQATMDAQAEAGIEPGAAGPSAAPAPEPEPKPKASSAPAQREAGRAPAHCPEFSSSDDELTLVYQDTTSDPSEDEADAEFQAGLLERANKREKETE